MELPSRNDILRPVLQIAAQSNGGLSYEKFVEAIAAEFDLTPDDLQVRIPSGAGKVKRNVEWAVHLLKKAGFLTAVSRGVHDATLDGQNYLRIHDGIITQHWLMKLAGQQTISAQKTSLDTKPLDLPVGGSHAPDGYIEHDATPDDVTPDEWIETSYRELLGKLIQDLLDAVKSVSPERFEQLVVDLLGSVHTNCAEMLSSPHGDYRSSVRTHCTGPSRSARERQTVELASAQRDSVCRRAGLPVAGVAAPIRQLAYRLHTDEPLVEEWGARPGV